MSNIYPAPWSESPHAIIDPSLAAVPDVQAALFNNGSNALNRRFELLRDTQYRHHVVKSEQQIVATARDALVSAPPDQPTRALILGGGSCNDIPLKYLVAAFDHTTLVDISPAAAERAITQLPEGLLGKVSLVGAEASGILGTFASSMQELADSHADFHSFADAAAAHMASVEANDAPPKLAAPYTFVSSHLVMSQIMGAPGDILDTGVGARTYGRILPVQSEKDTPLPEALTNLQGQLRQAHVNYLGRLVADTGTVHFADTLTIIRPTEGHLKRKPLVDGSALQNDIAQNFTEIRPPAHWVWKANPPFTSYGVTSYALEPRAT
jgi:hypothetical protein